MATNQDSSKNPCWAQDHHWNGWARGPKAGRSGRVFPHKFGGLGDLKTLYQACAAGRPLYLMRGDGAQMGWVVIGKVSERSSYLDAEGIGRVIDVDISVMRASKPSNGSFFSLFSGMFS